MSEVCENSRRLRLASSVMHSFHLPASAGSPQTVEEEPERTEPRPDVPGAQEGVRRPWWRRVFGG